MTGVPELQARIEALSSEITVQKQLLRNLERDKSQVQRRLNAVLDPVARLPLEISSEIFLQTLSSVPERPSDHYAPMLLLNVCSAWSNIAISTAALWAAIHVDCSGSESFEEGLKKWLQRAGSRPLSISISLHGSFHTLRGIFHDGDVPASIWEYGKQLQRLQICVENEDEDTFDDPELIYLFGDTSPGPLPLLEALSFRSSRRHQTKFSGRQILDLLGLARNLVECTFQGIAHDKIEESTAKILLPSLCRLKFGEPTERPSGDASVLKFLTLPALQTLDGVFDHNLLSFLERSSPPLKEWVIAYGFRGENLAQLLKCLGLVLSLEVFEVWRSGSDLLNQLLAALANPSLVPDLQTVRIVNAYKSGAVVALGPDSYWKTLLRVLASRPKIRIVHVEMDEHAEFIPSADILTAFRELMMGGLQIYIGIVGVNSNLVSVKQS
ncbi:hypothetical protein DFH06DRAFT_292729 [Mycena polygramma]|nr:hypothetical protein DFH06DRAFT_292729 [Mycena polygramma]